jgi:hypothetical protein
MEIQCDAWLVTGIMIALGVENNLDGVVVATMGPSGLWNQK